MVDRSMAMIESGTARLGATALSRVFACPTIVVVVVYLVGFVVLDRISFIDPYTSFGITPWNPNTGLSFVLVLLFGRRMIPYLFAAPLLADLVSRQLPLPWPVELGSAAVIGGIYGAALAILTHPKLRFGLTLSSMRDLRLLTIAVVASAALVASGYVGLMIAAGQMQAADFVAATLRYWVGDVIGIMVVAPLALIGLTRPHDLPFSTETVLQIAAAVAALMLVFGFAQEQQFQLFYVLFLPIVWMAVRTGIEGVSIGIVITQIGLIVGVVLVPDEAKDVTAFQALMLVLAMTGLVAGELVTERRRAETALRLHQDSLAHLARLGSMGELAAAMAHELNQPLMAAGTYTRLVDAAIRGGDTEAAAVAEAAKKAVAQVERAAEVVRRLRALVRLDRSSRAACRVEQIVKEAVDLCQPDLDRGEVSARSVVAADLPPVMVDMLQIEQALINLLRNSIQAIGDAGRGAITIEATPAAEDFVEISVRDSGPGFPPDLVANPFLPFGSTKAEGLGIGLPLCRSIIEAHGGRLWLDDSRRGACVHFTLPAAPASHHG
jgi:signal transduction histidine kinase